MNRGLSRLPFLRLALGLAAVLAWGTFAGAHARPLPSTPKFEVSFSESVHAAPITGRVFVIIATRKQPEPRLQAGSWGDTAPLFGADVNQLSPGQAAFIDSSTLGYPLKSLAEIPAGDYYVQAMLNVYTECHRSDGHTIWVHLDQWEGQQWNRSPGNLYSEVQQVHLDPAAGFDVKLGLTQVIPPLTVRPDTEWVKHIKFQSKLLSSFWGQPIYLGATVLLPKGYDTHPGVRYPVLYEQDHFTLRPPFGFSTDDPKLSEERLHFLRDHHFESGYEFYQKWISEDFPRFIIVTFQHPTPYFDDSYAVNSVNNGPYGDALLKELIPDLEEHFRIIREPYARVLSGGSTGGWESLALQVLHPGFFGGTWTFYPDPIDFRRYQLADIYSDENAFYEPGHQWLQAERYMERGSDGQPKVTTRSMSQLEAVLGSHGRSGLQFEIWEAAYGPLGDDGYPKPLWDKLTGKIDHSVADYMRDHGYDLSYDIRTNWPTLAPQLVGKLHLYCGDMDNYYLDLAVYLLEDFLKDSKDPYYAGSFEYGRPMKGHGWQPMTQSELLRMMAEHITKNAPRGEDTSAWKYK